MTPRRTIGFTLIEMVVALGLLGIVGAAILRVLLQQRWTVQAQTERAVAQGALRAGLLYLQGELRELGHDGNGADILIAAAESLSYRAMRGGGVACGVGPTAIALDPAFSYGYRQPQAGRDSMLLFVEGDPTLATDDRWLHLPVLSVGAGNCAGAGGMVVGTALDTAAAPLAAFNLPVPLRFFEIMQVRFYQSGSDYWLGARSISASEVIQPILGPLRVNGLWLRYLDAYGAPAAVPGDAASIRVTLRASSAPVRNPGGFGVVQSLVDSLELLVTLRNQ